MGVMIRVYYTAKLKLQERFQITDIHIAAVILDPLNRGALDVIEKYIKGPLTKYDLIKEIFSKFDIDILVQHSSNNSTSVVASSSKQQVSTTIFEC